MTDTKELRELFVAAAHVIKDVDNARSDADGKISIAESIGLVSSNLPGIITAFRGAGKIAEELRDLSPEEWDDLYVTFLTEMEWEPTDDNRDIAASYSVALRNIFMGVLLVMNTKRPPRAEPA